MPTVTKISASLNTNGNPTVYPLINPDTAVAEALPEEYPNVEFDLATDILSIAQGSGEVEIVVEGVVPNSNNPAESGDVAISLTSPGAPPPNFALSQPLVYPGPSLDGAPFTIGISITGTQLEETGVNTLLVRFLDNSNGSNPFYSFEVQYEILGESNTLDYGGEPKQGSFSHNDCRSDFRIGQLYADGWQAPEEVPEHIVYTNNPDLQDLGTKDYVLTRPCKPDLLINDVPETSIYKIPCHELCVGNGHTLSSTWQYVQSVVVIDGCGCDSIEQVVLLEVINLPSAPFDIRQYKPWAQINLVSPDAACAGDCSTVTAGSTISFNIAATQQINDPVNSTFDRITWELESPNGNSVTLERGSDTGDVVMGQAPDTEEEFDFTYDEEGEYKIRVTVENICCSYTAPWFVFIIGDGLSFQESCGQLTIKNCSRNDYYLDLFTMDGERLVYTNDGTEDPGETTDNGTFTISQYTENNTVEATFDHSPVTEQTPSIIDSEGSDQELPLAPLLETGRSVTLKWPVEGAYLVRLSNYTDNPVEGEPTIIEREFRVIFDMCNITQCYLDLLNDLRCNKLEKCEDNSAEMLDAQIVLSMYIELLHRKTEALNNKDTYTTVLQISDALGDADQLIKYINQYCGDCGVQDVKNPNDCGCG